MTPYVFTTAQMPRNMSRALGAALRCFVLALALVGCGGSASWTSVHVVSGYQPPRTMTLKVSESAAGGDVAALEMALVSAFAERDIHATPMDGANARPSLRVVIDKWDRGSETTRGLLAPFGLGGLGEGEIVVDVEALSEKGESAIQGKVRSWVADEAGSIRAVGDVIANMVATGSGTSKPPNEGRHSGYP